MGKCPLDIVQCSLKWVLVKEGEKEDTGRGSWASFDIRTAKPDDPVPGLLDKVVASHSLLMIFNITLTKLCVPCLK